MTRLQPVFALLTLAAVAALAGCASQGPQLERPVVQLTGITLESASFREQTFRLRFDVDNPNPFPLPIRHIRYRLTLENRTFAAGETSTSFTVPSNGNSSFDLGVELDLVNSASSLAPLLRAGASRPLEYALHGSLGVAIPFARPLSFERSGTIVVH